MNMNGGVEKAWSTCSQKKCEALNIDKCTEFLDVIRNMNWNWTLIQEPEAEANETTEQQPNLIQCNVT
jgi:hypothetical protein